MLATANGRGPRPLTQISGNHIDEDECERRIEHSMQPGTLCYVHVPGKHTGATDVENGRFSRAIGMDKETPVFEQAPLYTDRALSAV
eukprot:COSAG01_NODE_41579_length_449_cov_5.540000_1_plen_87_part_00